MHNTHINIRIRIKSCTKHKIQSNIVKSHLNVYLNTNNNSQKTRNVADGLRYNHNKGLPCSRLNLSNIDDIIIESLLLLKEPASLIQHHIWQHTPRLVSQDTKPTINNKGRNKSVSELVWGNEHHYFSYRSDEQFWPFLVHLDLHLSNAFIFRTL